MIAQTLARAAEAARVLAYRPRRSRRPGRIVFHVGLRKTGSTAVQETLRANRTTLEPHVALAGRRLPIGTAALGRACALFLRDGTSLAARRVSMEMDRIARAIEDGPQDIAVLSDETVLGHRIRDARGDVFDMASRVLPVLKRAAAPLDVSWVIYLRDRPAWYASCWQQDVKRHGYVGGLEEWTAANALQRDDAAGIAQLSAALRGPVRAVAMDDETGPGAMLGTAILAEAGVPADVIDRLAPSRARNRALKPPAIRFMQVINADPAIPPAARRRVGVAVRRNPELFAAELAS